MGAVAVLVLVVRAVERRRYQLMGIGPDADQRWPTYLRSLLAMGWLFLDGYV